MPEMTFTETLVMTHCWCGIALALPADLDRYRRDNGYAVYCPLGHTFVPSESNAKKLEKAREDLAEQRRRTQAERDLREAEERSHTATRGHLTRYRKRVEHGVCPHCNRSFDDLRRHMRSKHRKEMKS